MLHFWTKYVCESTQKIPTMCFVNEGLLEPSRTALLPAFCRKRAIKQLLDMLFDPHVVLCQAGSLLCISRS